jgi:hypothetical protein
MSAVPQSSDVERSALLFRVRALALFNRWPPERVVGIAITGG